jgi:hypothetical protein
MTDIPPLPEGFTLDGQQAGSSIPPLPAGFTLDTKFPGYAQQSGDVGYADIPLGPGATVTEPSLLNRVTTEAGKGLKGGLAATGAAIANLGRIQAEAEAQSAGGVPADATAYPQATHEDISKWYNKIANENASSVPSLGDIHSWSDAAAKAAHLMGGMSKYAAAAILGGVPGAVSVGALDAGQNEDVRPGSTPASVLTAAGIGGAESAILPPFLSKGITGTLAGGASLGALQGATANVPVAVSTGNPVDAVPSLRQILESAGEGAVGLAPFGAAHAIVRGISGRPSTSQTAPTRV